MYIEILLISWIIVIPLIAEIKIKTNYKKYKRVTINNNKTGREVAEEILKRNGLNDVDVVEVAGDLTDHYDPRSKVVRLSHDIYNGTSISSTAIAAHECGHAIQDKDGYTPMRFRSLIVPIVNIATTVSYWIILIGLILEFADLIYIGVIFTIFGLLFQIITLPVEFNASKRAKEMLESYKLIKSDERKGIKKVLGAAAMTYVAGVLSSALNILRLILMAKDRS